MTPPPSSGDYDPSAPAAAAPGDSDSAYDNGKQVEFQTPSDFHVPAGIQPGDQFDAVGTFRMKDANTMCLVELEGSTVKPAAKKSAAQPDGSSFVNSIEQGMSPTNQ